MYAYMSWNVIVTCLGNGDPAVVHKAPPGLQAPHPGPLRRPAALPPPQGGAQGHYAPIPTAQAAHVQQSPACPRSVTRGHVSNNPRMRGSSPMFLCGETTRSPGKPSLRPEAGGVASQRMARMMPAQENSEVLTSDYPSSVNEFNEMMEPCITLSAR